MKSSLVRRPWGTEDVFVENQKVTVKLIHVLAGEELSLQYHHNREEFWKVIHGTPRIIIGDTVVDARPGEEYNVGKEQKHRISAPIDDVTILEIGTGEFDENDIVRLEDKYKRV